MNVNKMFVLPWLIITLLFNSNSLPFNKSNLTHLDSLYFKHNKRHKSMINKMSYIPNIPQYKAVNNFNPIHIFTFNSITHDYKSQHGHNETKVYNSFNPDDTSSNNSLHKDVKTINFESSRLNSNSDDNLNREKISKAVNKISIRSKMARNSPILEWSFRDKDKMGDNVSEYEKLMSEIEKLSKSKEKSDKDLYSFIQKNFKESIYDPELNLTSHEVRKSLKTQFFNRDLQNKEWIKYMKKLRMKQTKKLEYSGKIPNIRDPVEVNLETKAKEDSCGFKYPIEGSPEEIISDPNVYRFWGKTPLSQVQTTHTIGHCTGKLEKKDLKREDIITSKSPMHEKKLIKLLKSIRETNFKSKMDDIIMKISPDAKSKKKSKLPSLNQNDQKETVSHHDYRYKNIEFGNYYEEFKNDFLSADKYNQERILNLLSPYNPWEEYIKLRNLRSTLPPIGINYKVNLKNIKVSFKTNESLSENTINEFLKEYLHYFLILKTDEVLFEEFKNAKFLHDILKYFDISYPIKVKEIKELPDLEDHFFKIYFPDLCPDGFPKPPPEPEFQLTMGNQEDLMALNDKLTGKTNSYHRVNMVCCLMALAKCYPLVRRYTSDIFTDQRIKTILDTLEKGLTLEMQRLEYGISDIEVNNMEKKTLCEIDGTYLSALTDVLVQWNITSRVENILDLTLLITLKRLNDIQGKHLVNIVKNISYLTTLPESVFSAFLSKIFDFVHEKLKFSLVNKVEWMELQDALKFLSLMSNFKSLVTPQFMKTFVQLYKDSIVDFGKDFRKSYQALNFKDKKMEDPEIFSMETRKSQIFPLVSCLQHSGLTEYMYLVDETTKVLTSEDFELNPTASISVLETFSESDEFQSRVIARTKNSLMRNKYNMGPDRILKVLKAFTEGVKSERLIPDSLFFCTMIKYFCLLKNPDSEYLIDACIVTDEFSPYLSRIQLHRIFDDLTKTPLYFNFLTRLGLQGEFLEYPIATVAKVLYYSSKNKVIVQKNWETFYRMITIFKHILSMKDIMLILDALIITHFTKADELLEILCKRVCNLIEVTDVEPKRVFEVMKKCMELDYPPVTLLRFYAYWNMYHVQGADHVEILLDGPKQYDVDFRGWKRPASLEKNRECINLHHNMYYEVKMDGSRAHVPHSLRYSMQRPLKKPRKFENIEKKQVDKDILKTLMSMTRRVEEMEHKFSETDQRLIDTMERVTSGKNVLNLNF
ncbi:uncharacterized protein TA03995 [Theileria annulata]|uniref:RAP domain-containing protein n=1 Tax=Theileria annulata TaxID=5874 RepID=Q4UCA7_THEAN|nr:uncharacterized protein TA03995 [Theileria annulata]CAI75544.1 hypothetical protein TA03995 [Theileria annulata]|eukprot:XP_955020.1 hypothetical protein TA03995 [Theileria annulata]